jgi:hypothetical protein
MKTKTLAATLALTFTATMFPAPLHAEAPVVTARVPVAVEKVALPTPTVHHAPCNYADVLDYGPVETIAWAEIDRLDSLGLPVCDVTWTFLDGGVDGYWGMAYDMVEGADLIVIDSDPEAYNSLVADVRTTVRHEFSHTLTYALGLSDADLRATFTDVLEYADENTNAGYEASADAIAEVLTPMDETRTWFYDEVVSPEAYTAAEALLANF